MEEFNIKNKIISSLLSFFIVGLGNAYNGLYKRFVVELGIAISIYFILEELLKMIPYGEMVMYFIGFAWWAYVLFDTMNCTDAINENRRIPLLLNRINIK